jgi:alpha-methylacyl-CoA racemase
MKDRRGNSGPLAGFRIIELAGIGPGPMGAMMLGDMGADVIRIDRPSPEAGAGIPPSFRVHERSRRSVVVDLRHPDGVNVVLRLAARADALIDPFRPGVAERLGIGPHVCLAANERLVYARITGWGQEGPLAGAAGHDINYIALTGVLHAIGREGEAPVPPLNLIGDYGGGGMLLAFGIVCALLEAARSGKGQVVDAAMIDGAALLLGLVSGRQAAGVWADRRGVNLLDSGAPFYEVYETRDGKYVSIGALEPRFYRLLLDKLGCPPEELPQADVTRWPDGKTRLAEIFRTRTRDEWCRILEGSDACFAPVLSIAEAPLHRHALARRAYVEVDGVTQAAPAPRFSRTPGGARAAPSSPGVHGSEVLAECGFAPDEIAHLQRAGVVGGPAGGPRRNREQD